MKKPLITMHVEGSFTANLVKSNQCGFEGATDFSFMVEIGVNQLDDNGFVCDALDVPKALQNKFARGKWMASCEELAGGAIYLFKSLCHSRAKRIFVRISPRDGRWIEMEWEDGMAMPTHFPHKVGYKASSASLALLP